MSPSAGSRSPSTFFTPLPEDSNVGRGACDGWRDGEDGEDRAGRARRRNRGESDGGGMGGRRASLMLDRALTPEDRTWP